MTNDELKNAIAVMKAAMEGKQIQYAERCCTEWHNITYTPDTSWDWYNNQYRVKPEPREWFVNVYPTGECALHNTKHDADQGASGDDNRVACVRVREVVE